MLTRDYFIIQDGKLFYLAAKRQKNNKTDLFITEQKYIPKHMHATLLARYHSQLMHYGYDKKLSCHRETARRLGHTLRDTDGRTDGRTDRNP